MTRMERPPGWAKQRLRILKRDGYMCMICGRSGADSIDHIVPRAHGGGHDDANLRAAHMKCNSRLGGRMSTRKRVVTVSRKVTRRWA